MLIRILKARVTFLLLSVTVLGAPPTADLPISATMVEIDPDFSAVYYAVDRQDSLLVGNDGSAATGGFRIWSIFDDVKPLRELDRRIFGRTGVVGVVYGIAGRDFIVSIAATDSVLRLFDIDGLTEVSSARKKALWDWSALCPWRSPRTGYQYFYLFGMEKVVQFVIRHVNGAFQILEVRTLPMSVEANSCTVSLTNDLVYFAGESETVYTLKASEVPGSPEIEILGELKDDVSGLTLYSAPKSEHLFVAHSDFVGVYTTGLELQGSLSLTEQEDIEITGLLIYQGNSDLSSFGLLTYALEFDTVESFGMSSLEPAIRFLGLELNTNYTLQPQVSQVESPQQNGIIGESNRMHCYAGYDGRDCSRFPCRGNCSCHGMCVGPNECECASSWAGPECDLIYVEAKFETDPHGKDGDDPAIWISPQDPEKSKIITTTKSEDGAGLALFDLTGNLLQHISAEELNNVDVIYNFTVGNRSIDLASAACTGIDALCLFEISPDGQIVNISGGVQSTPDDFSVYGSCVYRSPRSGKQLVFVNSKTGEYLQYELSAFSNGMLSTTLVRSFIGGSGGQVEGCVADDNTGTLFLGEESVGVWRYDAEPTGSTAVTLVARVGDGTLHADVEGLTLVPGKTPVEGLLIVSCQGITAFAMFRSTPSHEHVGNFTIGGSADGNVGTVTNTDGIAAVGTNLSPEFPGGLFVAHDDANELSGSGTHTLASFKLVSLANILDKLGVVDEVDDEWDPRSAFYLYL